MTYFMGVDLGTSSLKILIVDTYGKIITTTSESYDLTSTKLGYSEQDPHLWIDAFEKAFAKIDEKIIEKVSTMAVSGQMHSLVLLDENKKVLRPAILWNDTRTTKECKDIEATLDIVKESGNKALEGFTLPKILWVQKHEPEIWAKVRHILLPKDYLNFHLSGNLSMDYSDASGTLMLDFKTNTWNKKLLETFNIDEKVLPPLNESTAHIGNFKHIKVYGGGADNACGSLATGLYEPSQGMLSIGTSGVFLAIEEDNKQDYDGTLHYFNHCMVDTYYSMGVTLSAGKSFDWYKDLIDADISFDELIEETKDFTSTDPSLIFTPYIMGERTPHFDSKIRGSFTGLDVNHTRAHLTQAVLEGITFSLKQSYEIMLENGKDFDHIISVGGGAKNDTWLQMQANIFNKPVSTLSVEEGPAYGAAMIGAIGSQFFKTPKECIDTFVKKDKTFYPQQEHVENYQTLYEKYKSIYQVIKQID
ncbi:MAG TPA: xylulokinase [Erysipelothrix sp.]|nr:xylulokinase [Erysipelothrix sp.]